MLTLKMQIASLRRRGLVRAAVAAW